VHLSFCSLSLSVYAPVCISSSVSASTISHSRRYTSPIDSGLIWIERSMRLALIATACWIILLHYSEQIGYTFFLLEGEKCWLSRCSEAADPRGAEGQGEVRQLHVCAVPGIHRPTPKWSLSLSSFILFPLVSTYSLSCSCSPLPV
jgi:hypothetical protein